MFLVLKCSWLVFVLLHTKLTVFISRSTLILWFCGTLLVFCHWSELIHTCVCMKAIYANNKVRFSSYWETVFLFPHETFKIIIMSYYIKCLHTYNL